VSFNLLITFLQLCLRAFRAVVSPSPAAPGCQPWMRARAALPRPAVRPAGPQRRRAAPTRGRRRPRRAASRRRPPSAPR
jgi:hypothetical protein